MEAPWIEPQWGGFVIGDRHQPTAIFEVIREGVQMEPLILNFDAHQKSYFLAGRSPLCDLRLEHPVTCSNAFRLERIEVSCCLPNAK